MDSVPGTLAIIAGRDDLPRLIAEAARDEAAPYLVISFPADTQDWMAEHPHQEHEYEKPARLFRALRGAGVTDVVFAGATARPQLRPWRFDHGALTVAPKVLKLLRRGDDGLLSGLARIFEAEGFRMRGAEECLPGLAIQPGVATRAQPSDQDRQDASIGAAILRDLGPHDVGQAVVIARGLCLGLEAIEGTDALLSRIAELPPERRRRAPPPAGVLVKLPKPGQDRRVDLPTIGARTVEGAAEAGLSGIVVEAGGANLLDRRETIGAADRLGLFLWAAREGEL